MLRALETLAKTRISAKSYETAGKNCDELLYFCRPKPANRESQTVPDCETGETAKPRIGRLRPSTTL